jgi:hypothetical protein
VSHLVRSTGPLRPESPAYLSVGPLSSLEWGALSAGRCWFGWGVGALEGLVVRAVARAYFGPRLGLVPGRRHDV